MAASTSVRRPVNQGTLGMTSAGSLGGWCWWQNQGRVGLEPSPQGNGAISGSVSRTVFGESATQAWACFLKIVPLSLRLHWGFTVSCMGPKFPTKGLWSVDGYQIIVAERV